MSKESTGKYYLMLLLAANIPCIALLMLSGWFAYLDNGYWGWPFVLAIMSASGFKSTKEKFDEEREIRIQKKKDQEKYGAIYDN